MYEIANEKDMERALELMSPEQREHLRIVISQIVQCYIKDDTHGLLIIGEDGVIPLKIMAMNTSDIEAAKLMASANDYINFIVMEDAPPKEQFN